MNIEIESRYGSATKRLDFTLTILPDRDYSQTSVVFLPDEIGRSTSQTIRIRSRTGAPFRVTKCVSEATALQLKPTSDQFETELGVVLTHTVEKPGKNRYDCVVETVDQRGNSETTNVVVTALGR